MGPSPYIDPLLAQTELTEEEILLRREFARVFVTLEHFNAYNTCRRMGFAQPYCQDWAKAFMDCCVTRQFITEQKNLIMEEEALKDLDIEIIQGLREQSHYNGPGASHGARVSALMGLAKIRGLEQATKTETEVTYKGGVMMVPALTNPDEWGNLAAKSQAELKANVKD